MADQGSSDATTVDHSVDEGMELRSLLRSWRVSAARRLGRRRPLTQEEVAEKVGMSLRWYRDLERGTITRLSRRTLHLLAEALLLDHDERIVLGEHAVGSLASQSPDRCDAGASAVSEFYEILGEGLPYPAYTCDRAWNVIGHNRLMAEWFPAVEAPDANVIRWALTEPEARVQLADWEDHARVFLSMLRFSIVKYPDDANLRKLSQEILADEGHRSLWNSSGCVVDNRDGHRLRFRLSHIAAEDLSVTSRVLIPGGNRDLRHVVLAEDGDGPGR
ncbi:MmyB family transcriptional regulator [Salininema proteolyticum]|uniref:Helix-turn-helix domain-containing protein n=1 Tax=Salininema proteolyticum TaxID=1607685 RepID=A0ABV8TVZ8_9ACTN